MESGCEQLAANDGDRLNNILAFRYDRFPVLGRRITQLNLDDAIIFSLVISQDVEIIVVILWRKTVVDTVNDWPDRRVRSAQVLDVDIHSLRGYPVIHVQYEIAAILGHLGKDQIHWSEAFPLECLSENHRVG